jgi:hypothetical protein
VSLPVVDLLRERNQAVRRANDLVRKHNAQARTLRRLTWAIPAAFGLGVAVGYLWSVVL